MNKYYFILALILFSITSCIPEEDNSKTLQEYYNLGFPKVSFEWSKNDLEKAVASIEFLKIKDNFSLPKLKSEKSSEYFKKIIEELPRVKFHDSVDINFEFQKFRNFEKLYQKLTLSYGSEAKLLKYYSNEIIEMDQLLLVEITKLCKLYKKLHKTLSFKKKVLNMKNHVKFENGLFKIFNASINSTSIYLNYEYEDRVKLANSIALNIVENWSFFKEESKQKLITQLENISKEQESKGVRKIYLKLLKTISNS